MNIKQLTKLVEEEAFNELGELSNGDFNLSTISYDKYEGGFKITMTLSDKI